MKVISRRQFLKSLVVASSALLLPGCKSLEVEPADTPSVVSSPLETHTFTPEPISDFSEPSDTATMTPPASDMRNVDATSTASPTWQPSQQVATGKATRYDLTLVKAEMAMMLDALGGIASIVPYGGVVVMKVNLTGGVSHYDLGGLPGEETIATHPVVVQALGELLLDGGTGELIIAEAVYDEQSYSTWGYERVARGLNARLVDLNSPDPYPDFVDVTLPGGVIYPSFTLHRSLVECDTFISVAKMKCHVDCGITLAMKNLVGIVPARLYTRQEGDWWRSAFHGRPEETVTLLPRVVIDLNRVRPIHLAVVDGITTIEAGENSSARGARQVSPEVLVVGKNAVSTDAIATAVMGFDPAAENPQVPFLRTVNHLNLAYSLGMGTNRLEEIDVLGPAVSDLVLPFAPAVGYDWEG